MMMRTAAQLCFERDSAHLNFGHATQEETFMTIGKQGKKLPSKTQKNIWQKISVGWRQLQFKEHPQAGRKCELHNINNSGYTKTAR